MPRPLLLDVDTGVDDAIALALATSFIELELLAVCTVAGNVSVEHATHNTLAVLDWMGVDRPVYRGMSAPLVRPLHTAREHHGPTGLGNWDIPASGRREEDVSAPEAMIRLAREHAGEIVFVCTGPLTNLAVALTLEPRLVDWVERLVVMGGSFFNRGNVTPQAEFNVFADPEAAALVARSGMRATWVGLDVTRQTLFRRADWDRLGDDANSRGARLMRAVLRRSFEELGLPGFPMHDPLTVAVAEQPDVVGVERGEVLVDVGPHRRGETRVSAAIVGEAACDVSTTVDTAGFERLLDRMLR